MSPYIEFTGRNVEQAIDRACSELNIPKEKLQHDVISFGASGIFGLVGVKKAKIRVVVSESPEDVLNKSENDENHDISLLSGSADNQPDIQNAEASSEILGEIQPALSDDFVQKGISVLDRLVDLLSPGAEISVEKTENQIVYKVNSGNPALLIGKRGQTLESIQYLVKKVVNKTPENKIQVIVDIEGYVAKRYEALQKQALLLAEKACHEGKSVISRKFNPQERKIIHTALKNDERVKTLSKGTGYLKNIVVQPQKSSLPC